MLADTHLVSGQKQASKTGGEWQFLWLRDDVISGLTWKRWYHPSAVLALLGHAGSDVITWQQRFPPQ